MRCTRGSYWIIGIVAVLVGCYTVGLIIGAQAPLSTGPLRTATPIIVATHRPNPVQIVNTPTNCTGCVIPHAPFAMPTP